MNKRKDDESAYYNRYRVQSICAIDQVNRYGSGVNELFRMRDGLDKVYHSKVNPLYEDQNIKQQSGFSAEIQEVGRRRAEEAIRGETPSTVRTDDIGRVNDPVVDITRLDANGNVIPDANIQMKFIGDSAGEAVSKMLGKNFQKYYDADVKMMVPKDYFDGMKADLAQRRGALTEQLEHLTKTGKTEEAAKIQAKLDRVNALDKNLARSSLTRDEAIFARKHPNWAAAKDIGTTSVRAGLDAAKTGAVIAGSVAIVTHAMAYWRGEKDLKTAACDALKDTGTGALMSFATGASGAAIKGALQHAGCETLANSALPAMVAVGTFEMGKSFTRYWKGEITGEQCLEEVAEKSVSLTASMVGASIGQACIPVPVLGALIGSMVAQAIATGAYHAIREYVADDTEMRLRFEAAYQDVIDQLREERRRIERETSRRLDETQRFFDDIFAGLKAAASADDLEAYLGTMDRLFDRLGVPPPPETKSMEAFEAFMTSPGTGYIGY